MKLITILAVVVLLLLGIAAGLSATTQLGINPFNFKLTSCRYVGRYIDIVPIRPSVDMPVSGALVMVLDASLGHVVYACNGASNTNGTSNTK